MENLYKKKEYLLEFVATKYLENRSMPITQANVMRESGRIERVAEEHFLNSKNKEYNKFIIEWLYENSSRIVSSDELSYDVNISDFAYENNLEKYVK